MVGKHVPKKKQNKMQFFFFSSLPQPVAFRGSVFSKKKLKLEEGLPLPANFSFFNDRFVFIMHRDLTVSFNGSK
jgi:hypothetical protein